MVLKRSAGSGEANRLFPLFGLLLMRPSLRRSTLAAAGALLVLVVFAAVGGRDGPDAPPVFGALTWYSYPGALVRCLTEFMFGMFCWRLRRDAEWTAWLGSSWVLLPLEPAMVRLMERLGTPHPWLIGNLALMLLVIGLSGLSYRWIEKPGQRGLRRAFGLSEGRAQAIIDSPLSHPA